MLETEDRAGQLVQNDEYTELAARHREYEKQLEHIGNRRPFTEHDWFEENVVKKRRLQVRDRMAALARRGDTSH